MRAVLEVVNEASSGAGEEAGMDEGFKDATASQDKAPPITAGP